MCKLDPGLKSKKHHPVSQCLIVKRMITTALFNVNPFVFSELAPLRRGSAPTGPSHAWQHQTRQRGLVQCGRLQMRRVRHTSKNKSLRRVDISVRRVFVLPSACVCLAFFCQTLSFSPPPHHPPSGSWVHPHQKRGEQAEFRRAPRPALIGQHCITECV